MPQCLFFKKSERGGVALLREEVQSKIESLKYTTDETKSIYLEQLAQCNSSAELQELAKVIDAGEQQLFEIQSVMFETLESYIWKVNMFKYMPLFDKTHWIEKLIACDFVEDMTEVYNKAVTAEKAAKENKNTNGGWTILKED